MLHIIITSDLKCQVKYSNLRVSKIFINEDDVSGAEKNVNFRSEAIMFYNYNNVKL